MTPGKGSRTERAQSTTGHCTHCTPPRGLWAVRMSLTPPRTSARVLAAVVTSQSQTTTAYLTTALHPISARLNWLGMVLYPLGLHHARDRLFPALQRQSPRHAAHHAANRNRAQFPPPNEKVNHPSLASPRTYTHAHTIFSSSLRPLASGCSRRYHSPIASIPRCTWKRRGWIRHCSC